MSLEAAGQKAPAGQLFCVADGLPAVQKKPAVQFWHAEGADCSGSGLNMPGAQTCAALAPAGQNAPAGHPFCVGDGLPAVQK